uniref:Glycoprotein hormone subunit beta domain-containing protein n=1 Tax=Lates calcarifer TaxID=8187 RepID=A0A4W6ES21_LATCA
MYIRGLTHTLRTDTFLAASRRLVSIQQDLLPLQPPFVLHRSCYTGSNSHLRGKKKKQVCKQRVGINDSSTRSRREDARDPVYIGHDDWAEQRVCNGDWSYEVTHIKGCPVGVTYPVARNCECTVCNAGNTYCGRFPGDISTCLSS